MSGVSKDNLYNPDNALQELILQKQVIDEAVDVQALLRILVDKNIVTREEVAKYRDEVRSSPKYAAAIAKVEKEIKFFEAAKKDPNGYLKSLMSAKINGKL